MFFLESIKSDNGRAIIKVITVVLSLCSVLLVGWSNCEMIKQRQSAYRPVLSIGESTYSCESDENYYYSDGSYYISEKKVEKMILNSPDLTFKLENIGLGVAKNVKYEWSESNMELFIEYFQEQKISNSDNLKIKRDGDLPIIKYGESITLITDFMPTSETSFIKTDESDNNYIIIDASAYGYLCLLDAIYCSRGVSPEFVLNVNYEDMYSKKYSAEIHINYVVEKANINNDDYYYISFKTNTIYE